MSDETSGPDLTLSAGSRVLIIDAHAIVREGLSVLLALEEDLAVIGHVACARDCLNPALQFSPDLIVTELDASGPAGIEQLCSMFPAARILVLSLTDSEEAIRSALSAGANGYVLKESGRAEVLQGIRAVLSGGRYLCSRAAARVVSNYLGGSPAATATKVAAPLTRSERDILSMVAKGMSNKHIARLRERSVRTIEKQRAILMRKLGLRNAADLTRFALERGIVNVAPQTADRPLAGSPL